MNPELLLSSMATAWQEADGRLFASHFTDAGLFVAFDGSIHIGPEAIGNFHQTAFDGPLRGSTLAMDVTHARSLGGGLHLILTRGGVRDAGLANASAVTDSVQTLIVKEAGATLKIEALHNGRYRPIHDARSAKIWRDFDDAVRHMPSA